MRFTWLILFLIPMCYLTAAEIRDNQLFLEINLATAAILNLESSGGATHINDESQLFPRSYSGKFTLSVVNPDAETLYGILDKTEDAGLQESDDAIERSYFAWENGHLIIKRELQYFHPQSFKDLDSAKQYASQMHYPFSKIQAIPIVNSTLRITNNKGNQAYFESPLRLVVDKELIVNGMRYSGEFYLKIRSGKLVLNQVLDMEDYLAGVLPSEIGNKSPMEALKAQAVAARSHAVSLLLYNRHTNDGYDLCNGTHCQVYKGAYLQNSYILEAVHSTAGEIIVVDGRVADATYHSSCGGKTDSSSKIWKGKPIAHLDGVTCIPEVEESDLSTEEDACAWIDTPLDTTGMISWERGALTWEKSISKADLAKNAGLSYVSKLEIIERGRSGRILKLKLSGNKDLVLDSEIKIRQAFGNLLSSFFYIKSARGSSSFSIPATISLKGRGAGHGVGMCQVGVIRMARQGSSYREILAHYYPNTTISTEWKDNE